MAQRPASRNQSDDDHLVDIREPTSNELRMATTILANGMRDNPLHVEVFGTDPDRRDRRLLRFLGHLIAYVQSNGDVLGAYVQGEMIGVLGMIKPGRCRPALMDRLCFAWIIATSNRPTGMLRIHRWLGAWARNDPGVRTGTSAHWPWGQRNGGAVSDEI